MSRGPLPSQLSLLSSLAYRTDGEKVRFLGWYVNLLMTSSSHTCNLE